MASFSVNDLSDTGDVNPGDGVALDTLGNTTLRAAIEEANALAGADEISFAVAGIISLDGNELSITSDLTIDGGDNITVSANSASRVMNIDDGNGAVDVSVQIQNISLLDGSASIGGGVFNAESTTISSTTVANSTVTDSGSPAYGGGIANVGNLMVVQESVIANNGAIRTGGGTSPSGSGGGIANLTGGALIIDDSTVTGNSSSRYGGGILNAQGDVQIRNGSLIDGNDTGTQNSYAGGAGIAAISYRATGRGAWSVTITDSTVANNALSSTNYPYGGGVYGSGYGTFTITDSMLISNSATGSSTSARGGGGFFYGFQGTPGTMNVTIENTTVDGNQASADGGAFGIRARPETNVILSITNSDLTNNTANNSGGGIFSWSPTAVAADSRVIITDSQISGNLGGGINARTGTYTLISRTTISDNVSTSTYQSAGGVQNSGFSIITNYAPVMKIHQSAIINNSTPFDGGGLWSQDAHTEVTQSTISGNSSQSSGGGVGIVGNANYVGQPFQPSVVFNGVTVHDNYSAVNGGGAYSNAYADVSIMNSIVSGNHNPTSPDAFSPASSPWLSQTSYTLVGDNRGSYFAAGNPDPNGNLIGTTAAPMDPLLGALALNGGATLNHMPAMGSAVIDAGDPSATGGEDQRGAMRVVNGRVDMGAIEYGAVAMVDGDFNDDTYWTCADINMLTMVTAVGSNDPNFDLTGDGLVNGDDISAWLVEGGAMNPAATGGNPFLRGDADLNGSVDGADFIAWNNNKFTTNTNWCGGNFDGNAATDGADFIVWNTNKFMSSNSRAATASRPESIEMGAFAGKGKSTTNVTASSTQPVHALPPSLTAYRHSKLAVRLSRSPLHFQNVDQALSSYVYLPKQFHRS